MKNAKARNYYMIGVDGNICGGKTSLIKLTADKMRTDERFNKVNIIVLDEVIPTETLTKFYMNPKQWGLELELEFQKMRTDQLKTCISRLKKEENSKSDSKSVIIVDRTSIGNLSFALNDFMSRYFDVKGLFKIIHQFANSVYYEHMEAMDLHIYLDVEPEISYDRNHQRALKGNANVNTENLIPLEYLTNIHKYNNAIFRFLFTNSYNKQILSNRTYCEMIKNADTILDIVASEL